MKRWLGYLVAMAVFAACGVGFASAQTEPRPGTVIVPPTSVEHRQDIGRRAHTNYLIFVPAAKSNRKGSRQATSAPVPSYGETPSSLACIYQTGPNNDVPNCPISYTGNSDNPTGGSNVIAIVDAYDYPTAQSDFDTFSTQFGLPLSTATCANGKPCFTKVYATGSKPAANCGWAQEEALDIEWAHAMAPHAQIILVEAASSSYTDLLDAVQVASNEVRCGQTISCGSSGNGVGEVSMSWGGSEFGGEAVNDGTYFVTPGVTYFASSGDSGSKVIWPSASPNVVSAGGTTINRDNSGNFTGESAWRSSGGGISRYEPVPDYQSIITPLSQLLGNYRGTPDISFDADPNSGVAVFDSTSCQGYVNWMVFGGTSVSSPSLAGIFNLSGAFDGGWDGGGNSASAQNHLYDNYSTASSAGIACNYGQSNPTNGPFYDVTTGSTGRYSATGCWDLATGIGTLRGLTGMTAGSTSPGFTLSANPSSVSVTAGGSGNNSSSITVTPSGGYTGNVTLGYTAPSGITVSFGTSPINISGSSSVSSSVTVTADSSVSAGTYTVNVTGTDASVTPNLTSSTTLTVTVSASSSGGDFSLSASPGNVTLHKGGTASYTITVTPSGGFDQTVNFVASASPSLPQGSVINPISSVTGSGSTTLTVDVPSGTKGNYTLTITGTGGGSSHIVTVGLKSH